MKPLVIVGPTSSGKTALALWIAEQFPNAVILAIDSKQIYKHQDIVTGKDKPQESNVKIYGIDIINPDEEWSVAQNTAYVESTVKEAKEKNKFLIIVGGTPQYVLSLFEPQTSYVIEPDDKLRTTLEKLSLAELQSRLQSVDTVRYRGMNNSDQNNPRRLIRAIEVAVSKHRDEPLKPALLICECVWIGLSVSKENLESRIHTRVVRRIEEGAIEEYRYLFETFPKWTKEAKSAIGYKEIGLYENGELTKEELIKLWTLHEVQYAKRQMTWWKREHQIAWFDSLENDLKSHVLQHVKDCYNR